MRSQECERELKERIAFTHSLASFGRGRFVSGGLDGKVRVWKVGSWECEAVLDGTYPPCLFFVASFGGGRVVSGGLDGEMLVWKVGSSECLRVLGEHQGPVTSALILGGGRMVSGGWDKKDGVRWLGQEAACDAHRQWARAQLGV